MRTQQEMCSRERQRGVHTYKETSRHEDTIINVQQAKRHRGVHTYKEPRIYSIRAQQ